MKLKAPAYYLITKIERKLESKMTSKSSSKQVVISIAATDLAPLCGMDNYNNWPKIITKIWKKLNKQDFEECEKKLRTSTDISLACDSIQKQLYALDIKYGNTTNLLKSVKTINSKPPTSSNTLVQEQKNVINTVGTILGDSADSKEKAAIASLIKSATNMRFGCANETNGFDIFTKNTGKQIINKQHPINLTIHEDANIKWVINGRADGITADSFVVEIKNRQQKLFNKVRDYEMCQIQLYLHTLNITTGYLVEILPGDATKQTQFNIIEVSRDQNYFKEVVEPWLKYLIKFCQESLFTTAGLREQILRGDIDRKCFNSYCISCKELSPASHPDSSNSTT